METDNELITLAQPQTNCPGMLVKYWLYLSGLYEVRNTVQVRMSISNAGQTPMGRHPLQKDP